VSHSLNIPSQTSMRATLTVSEGRIDYCCFLFAHYFFLFIVNLFKYFHLHLSLSRYVFFLPTLAKSRHTVMLPSPLSWPYDNLMLSGPTPGGVKGHASSIEISLFCCVIKVLLMHLQFYIKINIILSNT